MDITAWSDLPPDTRRALKTLLPGKRTEMGSILNTGKGFFSPTPGLLLSERRQRILGALSVEIDEDSGSATINVFVRPSTRRRGLGRALVITAAHCPFFERMNVICADDRGQRFYEALGARFETGQDEGLGYFSRRAMRRLRALPLPAL